MMRFADNDYRVLGNGSEVGRFDSPYSALEFLRSALLRGEEQARGWVVVDSVGQVLVDAVDALEAA